MVRGRRLVRLRRSARCSLGPWGPGSKAPVEASSRGSQPLSKLPRSCPICLARRLPGGRYTGFERGPPAARSARLRHAQAGAAPQCRVRLPSLLAPVFAVEGRSARQVDRPPAHTSGPRLHCRRGLLLPLRSSLPLSLPPRPARRACLLSSAPPSASSLSAGPSPRRPSVSSIPSETQASVRPRRSHGPARLVPSAVTAGALAFLPLRLTGPSLLLYSSLSRRSRERPRTP